MKIAHVSKLKRSEGHLGGVEKFASHLKAVFPEMDIFGVDDVPGAGGSDLQQAKTLNTHLLASGRIDGDTVVVTDGFWQAGLDSKVRVTVNVSHGTWIGVALANELHAFGDTAEFLRLARWQGAAYRAADVVVAVSPLAQWELKAFYGLNSVLIYNGVDMDVFHPADIPGKRILHCASPGRKQLEMVEDTAGALSIAIEHLDIHTGREEDEAGRWREGCVLFQPSLYEGCSYASIEAMACGLVPVSFGTGLFWNLPGWAAIATDDHYPVVYKDLIVEAMARRKDYNPRRWIAKNASMKIFAQNWRGLMERFA